MKKKFLLLILITSLFIIPSSYATSSEDIILRVGLKALYERVPMIQINNTTLVVGYMVEDQWRKEVLLNSASGFKFTPANRSYLISIEFFNNYEAAKEVVRHLGLEGIKAYPGSISLGMWKIFVENDNETVMDQVNNRFGLTYHQIEDNELRVVMEADEYGVIFDNGFIHPVFETIDTINGIRVFDLGERKYRGRIEIGRYKSTEITAINIVTLEEYLYGVLPGEMSPNWPMEALKAQAVAARTYARYYRDVAPKYRFEPYDVCDTTNSQVYKGFSVEHERSNLAIDSTKGVMVYYGNNLIPTYFFSTSGGHTENSEDVWSAAVPYLKGVPDIYETDPSRRPWVTVLTPESIKDSLNRRNVNIGDILDVNVVGYTDAGRVTSLRIIGTGGEYVVNNETTRIWFGLYSRKFKLIKEDSQLQQVFNVINRTNTTVQPVDDLYMINGDGVTKKVMDAKDQFIVLSANNINNYPTIKGVKDQYIVVGQGFGHGVGMSQSGAKGMAQNGYTYDQIIEYYYTGVKVR
ncbi:stage II sporulation protein D [Natranaerovirga pectinivora]|uniref:Stage II sporulation protein D n=1 Tax=Natranaerovirga pectinivora TaxID=682400 RepID=A0A4R3MQA5_9FIRM|nr:SpoIID/LytB domain-containing protein [Natranaerovirga pectinivora]TCT15351.1 stage II sporulation protein D [Natranaerovirga pectinivora]